MANMKFNMPEDFIKKISSLGDKTDEIIAKVLEAGAEVVETEVRNNLETQIGNNTKQRSKSTGQLISALGTASVRQDKKGVMNVKIGFSENRRDGKKNAMIATVLEYGKSNQKARPFIKPSLRKSKDACINAMIRKLDEEIERL